MVHLLMQHNPNIFIVTGRPRTPRDQGSVESANKLVQRVLKSISAERRMKGLDVNWTNLLGQVMAVCNSQTGTRSFSRSSYQAVYGQMYYPVLRCPVDMMRKCTSIHQRLKMSPDERLEKYVMDEDIVDIEDDHQVEASCYEDEVEVDDSLEEEGDDINNNTFPDCDRVDDVKDGGLDTNAAEGQKERENASNLPVDEDNVGGAEFGFEDIADFIGDIIGDKNIVQPAVSQERAVKKSRSAALSRYGTNVTPTQSNLEALCLEVNQFPSHH